VSNDGVLTRLTPGLSDRYRIDRELGAGGMATVFRAHDLRHDRDVAIKVLHRRQTTPPRRGTRSGMLHRTAAVSSSYDSPGVHPID